MVGAVPAAPANTGAFSRPDSRPNVLLVMTDDQGYGDLHFHGNEKINTPVLDRLAAQSTRFDRFFVSPLCTPTRASLLSGRYYTRTGAISVTRGLETMRSNEVTIAEVLKQAGYATGCFGKWHLGEHYPNHPIGQGFDEFFGLPTGHWDNYFDPMLQHNTRMVSTKGYITDVLTDAAIRFIRAHRDQPFFCYVPYNAPHTPLQVADRYFNKYKDRGLDDRTAAIYGMVENIDENVGRLLQCLDELGLANRTIVFFLSDNGAEGPEGSRYNAGMRGMKGSVHEGGSRVPCFVRWPGRVAAGRVVTQIAAHIDLLPTIAELCGVKAPKTRPLDGVSLVPLLMGRAADWPDRTIFTRMPGWRTLVSYIEPVVQNLPRFPGAVRTQRWRLVNEGSGWQLYDMIDDPGQKRDIAAEHPQVVQRLSRAYEQWYADVTREPIRRPAIAVGYAEWPAVELPAPEAYFTGSIRWYNRWGFAHDWLTGWTNTADTIAWQIDVVHPGRYEVTVRYACPRQSVGTRLRVEAGREAVEGAITRAHPPQPRLRPTRSRKVRYIQTFATATLGTIALDKGQQRITLKAVDRPGPIICDVQSIGLRRLP
ncbi:MAG: arylsulfatase [Planctomycetes bacterium]|nr:arylsulfatase [Planctomycetota bacterium]